MTTKMAGHFAVILKSSSLPKSIWPWVVFDRQLHETSHRSILYWRYRKSSLGTFVGAWRGTPPLPNSDWKSGEKKKSVDFFAPRDHGMESPFILLLDLPQVLSWYMIQYGGWTSKEVFFTGAARLFNTLWKSESDRMLIFALIKSQGREDVSKRV